LITEVFDLIHSIEYLCIIITTTKEGWDMIFGIILMFCGLMIALYPPLLAIIVAALLFVMGGVIVIMSYRYKKVSKKFDDPFIDFFMKL